MSNEKPAVDRSAVELLFGLMYGYFASRAIHVAAELGIADRLRDGPKTVDQLASATATHRQSLYRLLRMLAGYGVFAENRDGQFELTPAAALLQTGALRDVARIFNEADWNAYGNLLYSIKTGQPAFEHVNGMGAFDYYKAHPDAQDRFDRGMANFAEEENRVVARAYDFGKFRRILDVGGGRGGLLAEILKVYPFVQAVLFDQPQVVANPEYLRAAGVLDSCQVVGGNFFESVPKGADAYVLKRIIHDWNDDTSAAILRRCRDAVLDGGRIIVVDAVVPTGNEFHPSKPVDLLMMVLLDGRERTDADFRELFGRAGLKLNRVVPTEGIVSIVEGERI
jgi:SAM-dependent methyltransferase